MIEEGGGWEKQTLTPCVSPVPGSLLAEPLSLIILRKSSLCPFLDLEVKFPYALLLELDSLSLHVLLLELDSRSASQRCWVVRDNHG